MKQADMKQNLTEDQALDAVLAQMAEEVPPMPADFHARWTGAVRREAEREPAEEKEQRKTGTMILWTRILSVAAVFIFLIGGTLLYRNSKKYPRTVYQTEEREPEAAADETAAAVSAKGAMIPAEEADGTEAAEDAGVPMAMFSAYEASEADRADGYMGGNSAVSMEAAEAPMEMAEEAEAAAEDAEEPMPLLSPAPTEETEKEAEEAEAEQGDASQDAGNFFRDMGDFLLAALPYLAVPAVPAAVAVILRKRKTK